MAGAYFRQSALHDCSGESEYIEGWMQCAVRYKILIDANLQRGSILLGSLLIVAIHGILLQPPLLFFLLHQQPLLLRTFLLPSLLRSQLDLLSLLPILLQLQRIAFLFDQLLLQMPEHFNDLSLCTLLDPFLDQLRSLILVIALDIFNHHIVEIITQDLPYFVAAFRLLAILLLPDHLDIQLIIIDKDLLALPDVDLALSFDELDALVGEFQLRRDVAVEGEEFGLQYFLGGLGIVLHLPVPGVYVPDGAYRLWLLHHNLTIIFSINLQIQIKRLSILELGMKGW